MKKDGDFTELIDEGQDLIIGLAKKIHDDLSMEYSAYEYHLLIMLKRFGKAKLKDLAGDKNTKPLVCTRLGAMERKGYVRRETDLNDRRNVYYMLAPKGDKHIGKIAGCVNASIHKIFNPLSAKDIGDLVAAQKIVNNILKKVVRI